MNYQKFHVRCKIALIFAMLGLFFISCSHPVGKTDTKTLVSITITTSPTKTTYVIGESLVLTGLAVTGVYSDGSSAVINNNEITVSGFDSVTPGSKTVTVTYGGKSAHFIVTVNAAGKTLTSILITGQPVKTAYTAGESLVLTGLVVTAVYSDGSIAVINNNELAVSGFDSVIPGSKTVTVSYGGKTADFTVMVNPADKSLISILITGQPVKTTYTAGESLVLTGLVVTAVYSDGSIAVINNNELAVSGFESVTPGSKTVTVSYGGKTADFTVTVNAAGKSLVSIAMTTSPTKTTYAIGESLVLTGLVVTAFYSDGSTAVIDNSELTVSNFDSGTPGSKMVTVSYGGKAAEFTVMVNNPNKTLVGISINVPPEKTVYVTGEVIDLAGLIVKAAYSDGTIETINNNELAVNGFDSVTPGSKTVTVSYGGKSADFIVTVNAADKTLTSILITGHPTKTTYTIGESLVLTGLAVTVVYSDGSTAVIDNNELTVSGFDSGTPGSKTVTVSYGGKSADFTVTVNAADKTLTSILITGHPTKTTYTIGESLVLTGLVVTAVYSDGSSMVIDNNELAVNGFDSGTPGSKTVTVSYGGKSAEFTVTVTTRTFTVTLNPNGGNWDGDTANKTVQLDRNTVYELPYPSKLFYGFSNWYREAECINIWSWSSDEILTSDITLYARWRFYPDSVTEWLIAQPGGTNASDPINLSLRIDTDREWSWFGYFDWYSVYNAIQRSNKYVSLDLSACTMNETSFSGNSNDTIVKIILPDTLTSITGSSSPSAFSRFTVLKSFSGAGLTSIGDFAFFGCTSLDMSTLPAGITSIGDFAFSGCTSFALTSLPAGVTFIGIGAFEDCTNLTQITLPVGVTSISPRTFRDCTKLTQVTLTGVTSIGDYAFQGCTSLALTSLPAGLTSIGDGAFASCTSLALPSLPAGLTSIGASAFSGCTSLALTSLPAGLTSIGDNAFHSCTSLALTSLPARITSIGSGVFHSCTSLTQITLTGVTSIGRGAFAWCTNLTQVTLTEGLASIGMEVFLTTNLTHLTLPASLTSIGENAYNGSSLTTVTCYALTPPEMSSLAFTGSTFSYLQIKVPSASVAAYKAASGWSSYSNKIVGF